MRGKAIDNRPDIEITSDCPVTRRIIAIDLFICSVFMALLAWNIYQKRSYPDPQSMMLIFFMIPVIRSGIWHVKSVPHRFNSDQIIIMYGLTFFMTIAIIKWAVFWYWGIDVRKLPTVYEKWNNIFNLVSIGIAGAAAGLPDIVNQLARKKHADKSGK